MRVLAILGTRPEAIKIAPIADAIRRLPQHHIDIVAVRQQRDVLDRALDEWNLVPTERLPFSDRLTDDLTNQIELLCPDVVLVQGDTDTARIGAEAAEHAGVRCIHIEAGLRSGDLRDPFPEESNRIAIARLSWRHYAPTEHARANLRREGYPDRSICVVGNTSIDALRMRTKRLPVVPQVGRRIVVTGHRRENRGAGMERICTAIHQLTDRYPDLVVDFVTHPHPESRRAPIQHFREHAQVSVCPPIAHRELLALLMSSSFAITDSGGLQEEAPHLGIPLLVTRETTERPELIDAGAGLLVGNRTSNIVDAASQLLDDPHRLARMARPRELFGDGFAAQRIVHDLALALKWTPSKTA